MKTNLLTVAISVATLFTATAQTQESTPARSYSQKDTIHVMGHAHMDMNWLWDMAESNQMFQENFRQATWFLVETRDYVFSQSQATIYDYVKRVDPPLFEKVKKYVKEGRFELTGGKWTEGDENLSSGEAIARSYLLGQRFFWDNFGKMAVVGWLPDNFGHVSQGPQILTLSGCKYYYHHRCKPFTGTYWWIGSDNSKVLVFANHTYNSVINEKTKHDFDRVMPEKNRILYPLGAGDHGGGPTRRDMARMKEYNQDPNHPHLMFSTTQRFFEAAEKEMDGRPTHVGEMGFICDGCYTTVADIKEGNRKGENTLYQAEFFNTLRWLNGDKYPTAELKNLWEMQAFNQFHDILPGSATNNSNRESIARYNDLVTRGREITNAAFRRMADEVKFQKGLGQPIVAYNLAPYGRKALVEASVYSHEEPLTTSIPSWGHWIVDQPQNQIVRPKGEANKTTSIWVTDGSGKSYPAQIIGGKETPPGFTSQVQFVVDEMPAGGYKTFYVDATKKGSLTDPMSFVDNTFETDYYRVKFDMSTGNIVSLFDKKLNKEFVKKGEQFNTLQMSLEDKKGIMKNWFIHSLVKRDVVTDVKSVKLIENGPVRSCVEAVKYWGKSKFIIRTYIYKSYPRITYDIDMNWLETGDRENDSPILRAAFPLAIENQEFFCQVPFDVAKRPIDFMFEGKPVPNHLRQTWLGNEILDDKGDGIEVPAQRWADVSNGEYGLALMNRSKYGYSVHKGELRLTLMRAAGDPDPFPNIGKFHIQYAIYPHAGDWKNGVWAEGDDFNVPVFAAEPPSLSQVKTHATRPEQASFFALAPSNVVMSGMKQGEDGKELVVRFFESEGKESMVTFDVPFAPRSVRRLNFVEFPLKGAALATINGKTVTVKVKPHEIVTLGISK